MYILAGDSSHPVSLTCVTCHEKFRDSWDLCRHCQSCHGLQIYVDVTEDDHSMTSDSVGSEGTSETQGSASNSDVSEAVELYQSYTGMADLSDTSRW